MLTRIGVRNFRTHLDTTINLGPVTLLIGPNSSGKTNLLRALNSFAYIGRLARPYYQFKGGRSLLNSFMRNRSRFSPVERPIAFSCEWQDDQQLVCYEISISGHSMSSTPPQCAEKIVVKTRVGETFERDETNGGVLLAEHISRNENVSNTVKETLGVFFRDLGSSFFYHFEPSQLRNEGRIAGLVDEDEKRIAAAEEEVSGADPTDAPQRFNIYQELRANGSGLIGVLSHIKKTDARMYERFRFLMESFDPYFRDFKETSNRSGEEFTSFSFKAKGSPGGHDFSLSTLPDGFLRACAISVLCSLSRPPSRILLEELENGLDIVRLELITRWLKQAADPSTFRRHASQFIISSHSPIVLRTFAEDLHRVYQIRFDRNRSQSVALNLADYLRMQIDAGVVNGTLVDGLPKVNADTLVRLWMNRRIGGETPADEDM